MYDFPGSFFPISTLSAALDKAILNRGAFPKDRIVRSTKKKHFPGLDKVTIFV